MIVSPTTDTNLEGDKFQATNRGGFDDDALAGIGGLVSGGPDMVAV
jgi:hypothetical protein